MFNRELIKVVSMVKSSIRLNQTTIRFLSKIHFLYIAHNTNTPVPEIFLFVCYI